MLIDGLERRSLTALKPSSFAEKKCYEYCDEKESSCKYYE